MKHENKGSLYSNLDSIEKIKEWMFTNVTECSSQLDLLVEFVQQSHFSVEKTIFCQECNCEMEIVKKLYFLNPFLKHKIHFPF